MRLLRAVMVFEALLLFVGGIVCLACPSLISPAGGQPVTADTYIRCTLGFALIFFAVMLYQITINAAKFPHLGLIDAVSPAVCLIALVVIFVLFRFFNGYSTLWLLLALVMSIVALFVLWVHTTAAIPSP